MKTRPALLACAVTALLSPALAAVSDADHAALRAAYETARHAFHQRADGTRAARNPGQQWETVFDGRGFTARPDAGGWEWGLALRGVSVGGTVLDLRPGAGDAVVAGTRLSQERGAGLTEWFVNDGRGLEQGWTLARPPAGADGVIRLSLEVRGGLKPVVGETGVGFADAAGGTVLTYGGLKAWDATGRVLAARFSEEGQGGLALTVEAAGAVYPVTIDPVAQQAYIKASNTGNGDNFGFSVAISGDTAVVGATSEDSAATGVNGDQTSDTALGSGAAYVFVRGPGGWSQQAYLKASNTEADDRFGFAVAISGDIIAVAADQEKGAATGVNGDQTSNAASSSGAVYVFARTGTQWHQQAYVKASNTEASDRFGVSVALSGETLVVGAQEEDSGAQGVNGNQTDNSKPGSGAAYVFVRKGARWSQQAYLKASNSDSFDQFGTSVAVSGDTLVVGSFREASAATTVDGDQANNSAPDAGAAYVFVRKGARWSQQAYLKASNAQAFDAFGFSVAVSGDTVAVGAVTEASAADGINGNQADNSAVSAGAVYVFTRSGSAWSQQAYVKASNSDGNDLFGASLALSGDLLLISARNERSNATGINGNQTDNSLANAGAAYLFRRDAELWSQQAYLKASNTDAGDFFGTAVALSGASAFIGARNERSNATGIGGDQADNSLSGCGAAYAFTFGSDIRSLAKTALTAPGLVEAAHGLPGLAVVSPTGSALFEGSLTGAGSTRGRGRGLFSTVGPGGDVAAVLQLGDDLSGLGAGYVPGSRATAFLTPTVNSPFVGAVFQARVTGPGLNAQNDRALLRDTGTQVSLLRRTGLPVTELGATPILFNDLLENTAFDFLAVPYALRKSAVDGVDATNDSGILSLSHSSLVQTVVAREGSPAFGGGTFGAFSGRADIALNGSLYFTAKRIPPAGPPVDSIYVMTAIGTGLGTSATMVQGLPAPGAVNGETFGSLAGVSAGSEIAVRVTLKGGPASQNEGICSQFGNVVLQKGVALPGQAGLRVTRILRYWGVDSTRVMVQAVLAGTGVTGANNQALLLRQSGGDYQILLRTGDVAPGLGQNKVTVSALSAVDFDVSSRTYVVLGKLRGAPAAANQALWRGNIDAGDNSTLQDLRRPRLLLRKGDRYTTAATAGEVIRGLILRPVVDTSGAGRLSSGRVISGNAGHVIATVQGDRRTQELVVISN